MNFKNLTDSQCIAFGLIALDSDNGHNPMVLRSLMDKGLIEEYEDEIRGRGSSPIDRIPMTVKRYRVPIAMHICWCEWCSENIKWEE